MSEKRSAIPDSTAVRVALWRALHVEVDPPPHVIEDLIGLKLVATDEGWRDRPDMDPHTVGGFRASIVTRARFVEDLVVENVNRGVKQYVILGAGLDTFAQRRPEIASRLKIYEIDRPGQQTWKQQRLNELGFGLPEWLRFVPVNFEKEEGNWLEALTAAGFDMNQPAIVASTGVSLYLSREANIETLRQAASLAHGSTLAMTFMLPMDLVDPKDRPGYEMSERGARQSGTPFISFFAPMEILALAREAGFREARHVSASELADRYLADRTDNLRSFLSGVENFLVATNDRDYSPISPAIK